jgi:hypothetical protein
VPAFGVAVKVAVIAPPNERPTVGMVHWPSVIVNVVAVPALPSVGGSLRMVSNTFFDGVSDEVLYLTVFGATQV